MAIVIFFTIFVNKERYFEATVLIDLQIENIVLEQHFKYDSALFFTFLPFYLFTFLKSVRHIQH